MIHKLTHPERQELFCWAQDTMILSCLQNVMGEIYADDPENRNPQWRYWGSSAFSQERSMLS